MIILITAPSFGNLCVHKVKVDMNAKMPVKPVVKTMNNGVSGDLHFINLNFFPFKILTKCFIFLTVNGKSNADH